MWSKERLVCHVLIYHSFSSYFQVVPCLVWSTILHTECFRTICSVVLRLAVFPSRKVLLQDLLRQHPFYCSGKILLRSEGERVNFSFFPLISEKRKERYSNRTSVFWILFYYLDISELMWAMIWEFSGARLQLFPLYHLHFSKCHRLLLQPYWKSQECHLLKTDW